MGDLVLMNENGQPMASSRDIAEHFGKEHRNVLQSIENITAENSALTKMFFKTTYQAGTGKQYPMYLMNRDGFSLLAMGFTGKVALEWKIKYIEAFNAMEQMVKGNKLPKPHTDPAIAEKRAAAMELNARSRVAAQMLKLWNEAGVAPQYQAVAMQDYYPNLALPREALAGLATAMLDATTIAKNLGVFSKNGKPHSHAIAAVIKKLGELSAEEYALTPYQNKGHDGVALQYSVSVQHKVANWLEENGYPDTIRNDEGKKFTVRYSNHS